MVCTTSRVSQRFRRFVRSFCVFTFLCLLFSFRSRVIAQAAKSPVVPAADQILASYEGQTVSSVDIAGHPELNASQFASEFVQQPGQPFAKAKVDQTIAALRTAGKFENVRAQVDPAADGIHLLFILEPAVYFGIFQFPGAERFNYSRLIQVADYPNETPFNASDVERDRQLLLTFFREAGYFQAEVHTEVQLDSTHSVANVQFHSTLGRRAKFGIINIGGVPPDAQAEMQRRLLSLLARARGASIRKGRNYNRAALNRAVKYLQTSLQKEGMLSAQVKLAGAEYHADTNRADIHFNVNPGPKTHVKIEGTHLWPWTKKTLLPVYQGIGVDEETVQEGEQALAFFFQAKGFFDVKVDSQISGGEKDRTVDYSIAKGRKNKVVAVRLSGNTQLHSDDLMPHVTVQRKHFLSPGKFSDKLVRASAKNLIAVYKSRGFSDVQIAPEVVEQNGDIQVTFHVTEGPRDIVRALAIDGANTFPKSQFAPDGLKLAVGQPYSQANVDADRTTIISHYLQAGYLTASFRATAAQASKEDPHQINVVYNIYEGPKVFTARVVTLGAARTSQRLINLDISSIRPEKPLTQTNLLTAGSKLYEHIGVFDWAEVDPKRQIATQTNEDVLVKVHEAKRNEFTYGFGFELIHRGGSIPGGTVTLPGLPPIGLPSNYTANQVTFYGPRGTVQYTRNNFRGEGKSISVTGFAGRLDQRLAIYYIVPNLNWSKWKATASVSGERNEQNPIFSSQQEVGSYQVQTFVDHARKDQVLFRYSFSRTDLTRIEIPELVPAQDQHVRLSTLAANFTRDSRDNVLDEHKGVLQSLEVDVNTTKLGSSVNFAKLTGQAAFYKEAFHHIVWANSLRIGLAQPFANSRVPLSEKYFTGGGDSLRGFPLDGAGPQRQVPICSGGSGAACQCPGSDCTLIQVPNGGDELLLINAEARIPLPIKKGLSVVGFYDGGNVFPDVGFRNFLSLYSNNVGIGLRYSTPVGPIRFDLGRNLNPIVGIKATQYFISIGQAF
jgi:outer membrane protein insertion porin family